MEEVKKGWWAAFLEKLVATRERIKNYYCFKEGGKSRINIERVLLSSSFITCPLLILYFLMSGENTAYVGRSPNSLTRQQNQSGQNKQQESGYDYPVDHQANVVGGGYRAGSHAQSSRQPAIKFGAKQVLVREDSNLGYGFHAGSNLIGELQSTIDTRDPAQVVRVILPYGGKSRDGSSEIPKGTLLLGQVSYQGKGEKVFIQFQQAILPDGKAIKMAAIALDPKDYSTGLNGEMQSQAKNRALSTMGLSALAAMGNVMTEKESMGQYQVEAKANAKNALLAGVSRAAEVEAARLQEQTETLDYVQVEAGVAVVISLTQGLSL